MCIRYLLADSVSQLFNMTWANQTFGDKFSSDGRLVGNESITTVQCDTTNNVCPIKVPAPAVALVFFNDQALQEITPTSTQTYATTAVTRTVSPEKLPSIHILIYYTTDEHCHSRRTSLSDFERPKWKGEISDGKY